LCGFCAGIYPDVRTRCKSNCWVIPV
jgi:hypothetical protein